MSKNKTTTTNKNEPKTNRGRFNAIVRKAEKINEQLRKLEKKAEQLAYEITVYGEEYDYDNYIHILRQLKLTLEDLSNFDLEDSIPQRASCNF